MEEIYTDSRFQIYIHTNMATFKINSYSNSNFFIAQDIHLEHIVLHVRNTHMIHYINVRTQVDLGMLCPLLIQV